MMDMYVMLVPKEKKLKILLKQRRVSTSRPLEMLHIDLCGSMRIVSRGGKRYVCVIVDDYSCFTWTLFLASKNETFWKIYCLHQKG